MNDDKIKEKWMKDEVGWKLEYKCEVWETERVEWKRKKHVRMRVGKKRKWERKNQKKDTRESKRE